MVPPRVKEKTRKKIARLVREGEWLHERHLLWLYVVREARNCFVHGDVHDIEPTDWGTLSTDRVEDHNQVLTVGVLTQLSLFALQMLLLAATRHVAHRIEDGSMSFRDGTCVRDVLQVIHLDEDDYSMDADQVQMRIEEALDAPVPPRDDSKTACSE